MSKAFTKEDSSQDISNLEDEKDHELLSLPKNSKNYMTPFGEKKLRDELKKLLEIDRPEVVRAVSWAASNGDRSENADYIYGKRRLREIDRRVRFLQKRLEFAEVINPQTIKSDQVLFGCTVQVKDEDQKIKTYRIVGIDESEPSRGWVSWISPLARSLLNHRVGDVVLFKSPKGEVELEIVGITYQA